VPDFRFQKKSEIMKSTFRILQFALLLLAVSCGSREFSEPPSVVFGEPQPDEVDNEPGFPARLKGKYRSLAEGNLLEISDRFIISTTVLKEKSSISDLDSNLRLNGDTVYDMKTGSKTKVLLQGDSILSSFTYTDTVFRMNYDNVLRKFRGHYFLNTRFEGENWDVKKLSLEKGRLLVSSIRAKEDIEALETITESAADTSFPRKFNLSKKQFREFLGKDGFRDQSIYIREKGLR
jgi:Holliday junction resolvase